MKHAWEIDVNVLIIFFVRDEVLKQTFEAVKKARPRRLFLWQDGPREGRPDDLEGIERCRKVVEDIDWDCEVYTQYHDSNFGCDPSTFYAQKWAFSLVETCIILEDDMVADKSFFRFCQELLEKYKDDERINHICGVNFFGESKDCPNDYLFAHNGTGAWASWRRVAKGWDETYSFLDKDYYLKNLESKDKKELVKVSREIAIGRRATGKAFWESILGFDCLLNNRLVIIPKHNMVSNIGLTENATHGANPKLMPKSARRLFNMPIYEQQFPLKHPEYVVADQNYYKELNKLMGNGHPFRRFFRKLVYIWKCFMYGEAGRLFTAAGRKFKKKGK